MQQNILFLNMQVFYIVCNFLVINKIMTFNYLKIPQMEALAPKLLETVPE